MEVYIDTLCLLAQPELTENLTARKSDNEGDKKETFIQTGRRGGDDSRPRLAECGTNGAGSLTTSRPCSPIFMHR